jgi:hypothetical protein
MQELEQSAAATDLLLRACAGDASALANVLPLIYGELRGLAHRQLQHLRLSACRSVNRRRLK